MEHDDAMRMLKAIATASDEHDLEGIMVHFADDAVFEPPRGPDPWGSRFVGPEAIRAAFAARFSGIPDIRTNLTSTSPMATAEHPSGPSPERPPRDSGSKSEAAPVDPP